MTENDFSYNQRGSYLDYNNNNRRQTWDYSNLKPHSEEKKESEHKYNDVWLWGPYRPEKPEMDLTWKQLEGEKKYRYAYYENEKPKSLEDLTRFRTNEIRGEFELLQNLFYNNYKDGIKGFDQFNTFENLLPIKETAVILNLYDEDGRMIRQKREYMLEDVSQDTYMNANYIKTCY